jgi:cell division control protein 6
MKGKRLSYGRKKMDAMLKQQGESSSDKSAHSEETSVDPTYQVMKSRDAWKLLMTAFGFTFCRNKYCLPGKENRPDGNPNAQEGINYFSTIEDLRKNLCAYGLPEPKKALGLEKEDLCRWVRYAHVLGLADGACINEEYIGEPINQAKAWSFLVRLGFKFASGCYVIPGSALHKAKRFESAEDFYVHLAQFGIPNCDVAPGPSLSQEDRIKLDLFVYNPGKNLDTL